MADDEAPAGAWYAQYATWPVADGEPAQPMPDSHKHWAEAGSSHEAALQAMGYVQVPAPGADPVDDEHSPELDAPVVIRPKR